MTIKVIVQKWEEVERHFGSRPDGYSIHLTEQDRADFVQAYWDMMPDDPPNDYSRPRGTPYEAMVGSVDLETLRSDKGIRSYSDDYPGDGGVDGWIRPRVASAA